MMPLISISIRDYFSQGYWTWTSKQKSYSQSRSYVTACLVTASIMFSITACCYLCWRVESISLSYPKNTLVVWSGTHAPGCVSYLCSLVWPTCLSLLIWLKCIVECPTNRTDFNPSITRVLHNAFSLLSF